MMATSSRRFRRASVIILACFLPLSCNCYLWKQGTRVLKYTLESVPIKKLQKNPATPDSLRLFLSLVNEIRAFATDSMGLRRTSNYTSYISIDKKYLIDLVSAAGAADFSPYTWCYPLFGCWPLRGYFDRADADSEAARLARKGYDVYVGTVDAFSTLGFLSDPVYSFMRHFSVYRLANLIIHELTHATVYVKNQVEFDEELASFTGSEGALRFIAAKYGDTSATYTKAVKTARDITTYYRCIRSLYDTLAVVYKSDSSRGYKLQKKHEVISRFKNSLAARYDSLFLTPAFKGLEKADINNAFIAVDMTYTLDLDSFYRLYEKSNRNLRATMQTVKSIAKEKGDCRENLKSFLSKH
ncbi:MAG TPA: aminopeptidase [Chitinivibrionales bacterium]|nr:aminopeptidase [Chitinivibrionales bacterium]